MNDSCNIFFTDPSDTEFVFRSKKPIFLGRIIDHYDADTHGYLTPAYNKKRIEIIRRFDDSNDTKIDYFGKKVLRSYFYQKRQSPVDRSQAAFDFVIKNKDILNISKLEELCDIKKNSLSAAVNRGNKSFRAGDKLAVLFDECFGIWE